MGMDSIEDSFKTLKINKKFYFESRRLDGQSFNLTKDGEAKPDTHPLLESKKFSNTGITVYSPTAGRINANIEYIKSTENGKDIVTFIFKEGNTEKTVKNESFDSDFPRNKDKNFFYIPGEIPPSNDASPLRYPQRCYNTAIPRHLDEDSIRKLTKEVLTRNGQDPLLLYKGKTLSFIRDYLDVKNANVIWGSDECRQIRENIQKEEENFLPENAVSVMERLTRREYKVADSFERELQKWGASKKEAVEIRCFITREIKEKQLRQEGNLFESLNRAMEEENKK